MNVAELIAELEKFPKDARLYTYDLDGYGDRIYDEIDNVFRENIRLRSDSKLDIVPPRYVVE